MHRGAAILISLFLSNAIISMGCGPKCPEVKSAMPENELKNDDIGRVNKLVERRKKLIQSAESEQLPSFDVERLRFSVTAYEMAIQMQLRIIELSASSDAYGQNLEEIHKTRCLIDDVLEAKLLKPDDVTLTDTAGKRIQERFTLFEGLFSKEGEIPQHKLELYYEKGYVENEPAEKSELANEDIIPVNIEEKPAPKKGKKNKKKGKKKGK